MIYRKFWDIIRNHSAFLLVEGNLYSQLYIFNSKYLPTIYKALFDLLYKLDRRWGRNFNCTLT